MQKVKVIFYIFLLTFISSCEQNPEKKEDEQPIVKKHFDKGYRYDKNGWIYVHIEGEPYERGKQYGYLVSEEYKKAVEVYKDLTYQLLGMGYSFFVEKAVFLHKKKIPKELLIEMQGMADGLKQAGVDASLDDLIGWNSYLELTSNWWPQVQEQIHSISSKNRE